EVPPGDGRHRRVREEHRVEPLHLLGLAPLPVGGRGPGPAPGSLPARLPGQDRRLGEVQRHAEAGEALADVPGPGVVPDATVHVTLDADYVERAAALPFA